MTGKDYEAIAAALEMARHNMDVRFTSGAKQTAHAGVTEATHRIADVMARDNPRFDRGRFLKAAGVQS